MGMLKDLPLVLPLAEWVWGADASDDVSPELCLDLIPFLSGGCFSQLLTKALGVAIIVGACLNKAPIMRNMLHSQSAAGFSRMGMYSETVVYANAAAYGVLEGHPATAYGENLSLVVQNCILVALIWKFTTQPPVGLSEKLGLAVATVAYLVGVFQMLPDDMRYLLQASNGIIMIYSKGVQVLETYQLKHTGAQSIITVSLNLVGGLARIFTTLKETGDMTVVMGFALSVFLNLSMFVQYWIYKANTEKFLADLQADQKKKKE